MLLNNLEDTLIYAAKKGMISCSNSDILKNSLYEPSTEAQMICTSLGMSLKSYADGSFARSKAFDASTDAGQEMLLKELKSNSHALSGFCVLCNHAEDLARVIGLSSNLTIYKHKYEQFLSETLAKIDSKIPAPIEVPKRGFGHQGY